MPEILPINLLIANIKAAAQSISPEAEALSLLVKVGDIPEILTSLKSSLQIKGIIQAFTEKGEIFMRSGAGEFSFSAPEAAKDKNLSSAFEQLAASKKPLSITLNAGNPPTQAVIHLPKTINILRADAKSAKTTDTGKKLEGFAFTAVALDDDFAPLFRPEQRQSSVSSRYQNASAEGDGAHFIPQIADKTANTEPRTPDKNLALQEKNAAKAGTEANFRILKVVADGENALSVSLKEGEAEGVVFAKGENGQSILKVNDKAFFVRQNLGLEDGTKLILRLEGFQDSENSPLILKSENVATALNEVMSALKSIDPVMAQNVSQQHAPQPSKNAADAFLFLLSALRQGGADDYIGESAALALEKAGKKNLIEALTDEMSQSGSIARDGNVGEWKCYTAPLHDGRCFQAMHIFVHHDWEERGSSSKEDGAAQRTRFVIDLNLTRLGAMQIDGLSQHKKLDVSLRSEKPLPHGLAEELRKSYLSVLDSLGLIGGISFYASKRGWMTFQNEAQPRRGTMA